MNESLAPLAGYKMYMSNSWYELLERNGDVADIICNVIRSEVAHNVGAGEFDFIGIGRHGRVSAVPGINNLCVKTSSSELSYQSYYMGDNKKGDPEDLLTQARFMETMRSFFSNNPEGGVSVPVHYLAAKSPDGVYVSIQERLYPPVVTLSEAGKNLKSKQQAKELNSLVMDRITSVLGNVSLRLGVDDVWLHGRMNAGNVFIDTTNQTKDLIELSNQQLYVIDQPAHRFVAARFAIGAYHATSVLRK